MAQNKLKDLNNHLFAQLERLGEEDLTDVQFEIEKERAKAISLIAKNIVNSSKLALDAIKFSEKNLGTNESLSNHFEL